MLHLRDYQPRATVRGMDRIFIYRLKGTISGEPHMARNEAKALRAWLKIRSRTLARSSHEAAPICPTI